MKDISPQTSDARRHHRRKEEHLYIALNADIAFKGISTGLEHYRFVHQALPEIDLKEVDLSAPLLGKKLRAPLVISAMVGGIEAAGRINQNLALAAQALGLAMCVGSQRCLIEEPETAPTYHVRRLAPDILLMANLGAVQLNYGYGIDECRRAVESIEADALVLHLNPLQEAFQPGGDTDFSGLLGKIEQICHALPVPVAVKEVGWGISREVARKLVEAGVACIDVSGAGGTCWGEIERLRAQTDMAGRIAASFAGWGIPTTESVKMVRRASPGIAVIGSGGIRTGLDVAKVIGLGADAAGMAGAVLKAANHSAEAVSAVLQQVIEELRLAMFCTGAASLEQLKNTPFLRKLESRP